MENNNNILTEKRLKEIQEVESSYNISQYIMAVGDKLTEEEVQTIATSKIDNLSIDFIRACQKVTLKMWKCLHSNNPQLRAKIEKWEQYWNEGENDQGIF